MIWSQQGQQPLQEQYQQDIIVESWTITILTLLNQKYPLLYTLTPHSSNGDKFISFITTIFSFINLGDIILSDNCFFHQHGWVSRTAQGMIKVTRGEYKLFPKYCLEFSPAELIFSFLKVLLHTSFNSYDDLLQSIITILDKITMPLMLSWYEHCGWLK